jgi:hypothetical protein
MQRQELVPYGTTLIAVYVRIKGLDTATLTELRTVLCHSVAGPASRPAPPEACERRICRPGARVYTTDLISRPRSPRPSNETLRGSLWRSFCPGRVRLPRRRCVGQTQSSVPELLLEDTVLFPQIRDDLQLVAIDPPGQRHQQDLSAHGIDHAPSL